jgi:outer membrane lipopolysaccharide assembly protein LptE/RlpB
MKRILFIILLVLLTGCGFKVVNVSDQNNFSIINLSSEGNKRINYIIKNRIQSGSRKDSANRIVVDLITTKTKNVKEKNIKNEVTKYEILITINVKFSSEDNEKKYEFTKKSKNDYSVSTQFSQTRNNEKKMTELLSEKLAEEILTEIRKKINDI